MPTTRSTLVVALALALAACAGPAKENKTTTDLLDGAAAEAPPPPAAEPAPLEPGACRTDTDCEAGSRCDAGRCVEPPRCAVAPVRFAFDSAVLDASAMEGLREDARCIAERHPSALLVEGHADERGTTAYNIALGARRAEAVKRYLADLGASGTIDTVSFGEEIPAVQGTGEGAWAMNRRAELRLPGEARSDGKLVAEH